MVPLEKIFWHVHSNCAPNLCFGSNTSISWDAAVTYICWADLRAVEYWILRLLALQINIVAGDGGCSTLTVSFGYFSGCKMTNCWVLLDSASGSDHKWWRQEKFRSLRESVSALSLQVSSVDSAHQAHTSVSRQQVNSISALGNVLKRVSWSWCWHFLWYNLS